MPARRRWTSGATRSPARRSSHSRSARSRSAPADGAVCTSGRRRLQARDRHVRGRDRRAAPRPARTSTRTSSRRCSPRRRRRANDSRRRRTIEVEWERIWSIEPILFDETLLGFCEEAILEVAGSSHRLPSGPLHDAAEVARAGVPTVMMFVQSLRGLSHTKLEDTREEHLELAVEALDRLASKTIDWVAAAAGADDGFDETTRVSTPIRTWRRRRSRRRRLPDVERLQRRRGRRSAGRSYGVSVAAIGLLTTALFLTHLAVQLPAGRGADRFGSRSVALVAIGAGVVGNGVLLVDDAFGSALLGRAIVGIGSGAASSPGSTSSARGRRFGAPGPLRRRHDGRGRARAHDRASAHRGDGLAGCVLERRCSSRSSRLSPRSPPRGLPRVGHAGALGASRPPTFFPSACSRPRRSGSRSSPGTGSSRSSSARVRARRSGPRGRARPLHGDRDAPGGGVLARRAPAARARGGSARRNSRGRAAARARRLVRGLGSGRARPRARCRAPVRSRSSRQPSARGRTRRRPRSRSSTPARSSPSSSARRSPGSRSSSRATAASPSPPSPHSAAARCSSLRRAASSDDNRAPERARETHMALSFGVTVLPDPPSSRLVELIAARRGERLRVRLDLRLARALAGVVPAPDARRFRRRRR